MVALFDLLSKMVRIRPLEEKTEAILIYAEAGRNFHEAERIFNDRFPDNPICRKYLRELVDKFQRTGSLLREKGSGRKSLPEEQQIQIVASVVNNPQQSTATVSRECNVSTTTVKKYLKKHKFHPYKLIILHELQEDDPDRRIQFCEVMSERIIHNPAYTKTICFSDECTFFLNGNVNRQNVRYWSDENPHIFRENHTQTPEKVNVWAGILGDHIIGPIFLDENLTGVLYLNLLQNVIHPQIEETVANNRVEFENPVIFQQDGAPPHFFRPVRDWLDQTYPGRWIGRRGPMEWPARSPDLTPLDFFLWGYVKSKVYVTKPQTIEELKTRIRQVCSSITADTFQNVRNEFRNRLFYCQVVQGQHFENLLR